MEPLQRLLCRAIGGSLVVDKRGESMSRSRDKSVEMKEMSAAYRVPGADEILNTNL